MAKTLVIKGANFSANKVTTVEFSDIPCTGISFEESTIRITSYSDESIEYTVTPNDTTDSVIWESSDSSVATIADGVVTPVGIGSCTITATCGEYSATATVTVAFAYIPGYAFAIISYNSGNGITGYGVNYDYIAVSGQGAQSTEKSLMGIGTAIPGGMYGIKIPLNATKVKFEVTDASGIYNDQWSGIVQWLVDESVSTEYPNNIKRISGESYNLKTTTSKTFNIPEGSDSFVFNIHITPTSSSEVDPATLIASMGFGIEFLAE